MSSISQVRLLLSELCGFIGQFYQITFAYYYNTITTITTVYHIVYTSAVYSCVTGVSLCCFIMAIYRILM